MHIDIEQTFNFKGVGGFGGGKGEGGVNDINQVIFFLQILTL